MIVIFEGLDNCGKTTLVNKINDYYSAIGIKSKVSKEFETNIGKELKQMAKEGTLDPILKTYLFATDRYIRIKNISNDDVKNTIILFDRYVPSAVAYRMAEGIDKDWVMSINSIFPKADIGFYIDISPNESIKRNINTKFNIEATTEDLEKVRNSYLQILEENNLITINGMQPIDDIFKEVIVEIEKVRQGYVKRI